MGQEGRGKEGRGKGRAVPLEHSRAAASSVGPSSHPAPLGSVLHPAARAALFRDTFAGQALLRALL